MKDIVGWTRKHGSPIPSTKRKDPQYHHYDKVAVAQPWGGLDATGTENFFVRSWRLSGRPWDHSIYGKLRLKIADRIYIWDHEKQTFGDNLPEARNIYGYDDQMQALWPDRVPPETVTSITGLNLGKNSGFVGGLFRPSIGWSGGDFPKPDDDSDESYRIDLSIIDKIIELIWKILRRLKSWVEEEVDLDSTHSDRNEFLDFQINIVRIKSLANDSEIGQYQYTIDQLKELSWLLHETYNFGNVCGVLSEEARKTLEQIIKDLDEIISRWVFWLEFMKTDIRFLFDLEDKPEPKGQRQNIDRAKFIKFEKKVLAGQLETNEDGSSPVNFGEIWSRLMGALSDSPEQLQPENTNKMASVAHESASRKRLSYPWTRPSHAIEGYSSVAPEAGNVAFSGRSTKSLTEEAHGNFAYISSATAFDADTDWSVGITKEPCANLDNGEYEAYKGMLGPAKKRESWGPRGVRLQHLVDTGVVFVGTNEMEIEENRKHVFTGRFGIKEKKDLEDTSKVDKVVAVITRRNWQALVRMGVLSKYSPGPLVQQYLAMAWNKGLDECMKNPPANKDSSGDEKRKRQMLADQNHPPITMGGVPSRGGGAPMYPYNKVTVYECGHMQEWDSTPNMERVNLRHRTGTGMEWWPNGDSTMTVVGDNYVAVLGSNFIQAQGDVNIIAAGQVSIKSHGDTYIDASQDMSLNVGGDLRVMVRGDMVEEVMGNKYTRIHRHKQENIGGHHRTHVSRDREVIASAITNVTTDTDFNVSAKRDVNIAGVNRTELVGGRKATLESGGRLHLISRQDMDVFTSESFRLETRWDFEVKALRDIAMNAERGETHFSSHSWFRIQSRNDRLWMDGLKGIAMMAPESSMSIYAKDGFALYTKGSFDLKAHKDVRLTGLRAILGRSPNVISWRGDAAVYNVTFGTLHFYTFEYQSDLKPSTCMPYNIVSA